MEALLESIGIADTTGVGMKTGEGISPGMAQQDSGLWCGGQAEGVLMALFSHSLADKPEQAWQAFEQFQAAAYFQQ